MTSHTVATMWTALWTALALTSLQTGDVVDGGAVVDRGADSAGDAGDAGDAGAVEAAPVDVVADAEIRLARGAATEAVGLLLRHARQGELDAPTRDRAGHLLARAADVLAERGELKGAAVAADAASTLAPGRSSRARLSAHVLAFARVLADDDDAGARALAGRAVAIDGDNADAGSLAAELAGMDTWVSGHVTLGAGAGLWIVSATACVAGLERERIMRSTVHTRPELDRLHLERSVAAAVAWPAAVAGAVGSGLGLALILAHDPRPAAVWPHPFPALASTTAAP